MSREGDCGEEREQRRSYGEGSGVSSVTTEIKVIPIRTHLKMFEIATALLLKIYCSSKSFQE